MTLVTKLLSPLALALVALVVLAGMATAGGPKVRDLPDGGYEMEFDAPIHQVGSWHEPREKGKAPFPKVVHAGGAVEFLDERGGRKAKVEVRENERVVMKRDVVVMGSDWHAARYVDLAGSEILRFTLSSKDAGRSMLFDPADHAHSNIPGYSVGYEAEDERSTGICFFYKGRLVAKHGDSSRNPGTWSPDGKRYAVVIDEAGLSMYGHEGELLWSRQPGAAMTSDPVFSADGRYVLAGGHEPEDKGWLFDMAGNVVMELPTSNPPVFSEDSRFLAQIHYVPGDWATSILFVTDLNDFTTRKILLNEFADRLPGSEPGIGLRIRGFVKKSRYVLADMCREPAIGRKFTRTWVPAVIDWRKGKMKKLPYGLSKYLPEDWTIEVEGKVLRRAKPEKLDE